MLSYCLKCRKNTENKHPKVVRTKNGRTMLFSECAVCNSEKSKFIKEQEAKVLLGNLMGAKIPILGDIPLVNTLSQKYKMNAIVKRFLLVGDKFMPEMDLKQPGFIFSACVSFTKDKQKLKNFEETVD